MRAGVLAVSAAILLNAGTVAAQRTTSSTPAVRATSTATLRAATTTARASASGASGAPCSSVSSMSVAFMSAYPSAKAALVPAQAAEDCLKSVPLNKNEAAALIDEMKLYVNWQSNLAYLKNPPKGYNDVRVDILGQMDDIKQGIQNGKYTDDYSVMYDLSTAMSRTYDFHFNFRPDIRGVFFFKRGNIGRGLVDDFGLVSVSKDGKELPKLYNYYDIMTSQKEGWTPSPVVQIQNQTAEDYVQKWSLDFEYHEDHARYNRLFPNQAQNSMGSPINQFGRSQRPDGDYTTVKHENGTTAQYLNTATIALKMFDGVKDGASFYRQFLNLGPPSSNAKRSLPIAKRQSSTKAVATGFPTPQILHSEGVIGGYYLSGSGYDDVAVLSVPSFGPETDNGPQEFQDITGQFLNAATAAGKKRLVIDLRGNGGGLVFMGYDMFKQLFPSQDPFGASTFRANQAFDLTGQYVTEVLKSSTYQDALRDYQKNGAKGQLVNLWQSIFNYKLPNTVENKNFTSWQSYFGPQQRNGDNFTVPSRKDLDNFFSDDLSIDVTGYRTRASKLNTKQPFDAKNIVLLQDGGCGSTCAVFSEFMKSQGGVQQIVVGGLPKTGAMQGVAGSKGSQVLTWTEVYKEAYRAYANMPQYQASLNKTELGQLVHAERPLMRTAYSSNGYSSSRINLRDNIRKGDSSVTPLEFVYEAADCRLFYTGDMVRNTTDVWKKTVDAQWGDKSKVCVDGSTGDKTSISGGFTGASTSPQNGAGSRMGAGTALAAVLCAAAGAFALL